MERTFYDDFGHPAATEDPARADAELDDLFVETGAAQHYLESTRGYPLLVGTKGTGKTLLLFKKAVLTTKKAGVLVFPRSQLRAHRPSRRDADSYKWASHWPLSDDADNPDVSKWAILWEWALLQSVLRGWLSLGTRERPRMPHWRLLEALVSPDEETNPFTIVSDFLRQVEVRSGRIRGKPVLPDPKPLSQYLRQYGQEFPPTFVFLDNQDDFFFESPETWRASGCGCFLALRDLQIESNHRLHFSLTLRPEVLVPLSESQHWPSMEADVFHLTWEDHELLEMFERRIGWLKPECLIKPAVVRDDALGAFFGDALRRDGRLMMRTPLVEEGEEVVCRPIAEHLLRHTLRRPRDLIILGNKILERRRAAPKPSKGSEAVIRTAVDQAASDPIARGYCAEIAHLWPWSNTISVFDFLANHVSRNVLSRSAVEYLEEELERVCQGEANAISILAFAGLIGWPERDASGELVQVFVQPGAWPLAKRLPAATEWFLVHPILYSQPFSVEPVRGLVVGPGLPFLVPADVQQERVRSCIVLHGVCDENDAVNLRRILKRKGVRCASQCVSGPSEIDDGFFESLEQGAALVFLCSVEWLSDCSAVEALHKVVSVPSEQLIGLEVDRSWKRSLSGSAAGVAVANALSSRATLIGTGGEGLAPAADRIAKLLRKV